MKVSSDTLPGLLMDGWGEVTDDLHDISGRVIEKDPDARLVVGHDSGVLALAKYVRNEEWIPGGGWVVAMRFRDEFSEDRMFYGEPDARLLTQMDKCDMQKRDPVKEAAKYRVMQQLQEVQKLSRTREWARERAEVTVHKYRKKVGRKAPKIFVPGR